MGHSGRTKNLDDLLAREHLLRNQPISEPEGQIAFGLDDGDGALEQSPQFGIDRLEGRGRPDIEDRGEDEIVSKALPLICIEEQRSGLGEIGLRPGIGPSAEHDVCGPTAQGHDDGVANTVPCRQDGRDPLYLGIIRSKLGF